MTIINNKYFRISLIALIFLVVGIFIGHIFTTHQANKNTENHQSGYHLISPLLDCNSDISTYDSLSLKKNLERLIQDNVDEQNINSASIYFRDLNNGPWIGINEEERFSPASLLKVPIMIAYLKIAENKPDYLQARITINNAEENTGVNQNILPLMRIKVGQEYSIEELLEYMIEYSDNTAANALIQNCPEEILSKVYSDLNLKDPLSGQPENFMAVTEYSSFFRILYNASYLNREMSEKALSLLTKSNFNNGLVAGLPANTLVAHKFGERVISDNKQLHDCGIIYKESNNYLLCVMTRGNDFRKMENTIKEISALVYKNANNGAAN